MNTFSFIPKHIAIIMDGNGRWAKNLDKPRSYGHRAGHTAVLRTVRYAAKIGIKSLTLYAFSSENWLRPKEEIKYIMFLFQQSIKRNKKLFIKHKIRFNVIGNLKRLSEKLQQEIKKLEKQTAHNTNMTLNIAVSYSGKWDIVQATKKLAHQVKCNNINNKDINESLFNEYLMLADQDPVDLLIRTGGEQRISNYLLWQCAYAEFYFTTVFWPEFNEDSLDAAIADFGQRTRRFGGIAT